MEKIRELINEFVEAELKSFKYDEGNLHIEMTRDPNGYVEVSHQEGDDDSYFLYEAEEYTDAGYDDEDDDEDDYDDLDYDEDDEDDFY